MNPCIKASPPPAEGAASVAIFFEQTFKQSHPIRYRFDIREDRFASLESPAESLLGYSLEEFRALRWTDAKTKLHPEDLKRLADLLKALRIQAPPETRSFSLSLEYRWRAKSGDYAWLNDRVTLRLAPDGGMESLEGFAYDVTAQRLAEYALRGDARAPLTSEASPDGVWDSDLLTGDTYYSPAFCDMLGFTREEFGATIQAWWDRLHPEDVESAKAAVQAHLSGESPNIRLEFRMRAKNNEWKWILCRGKLVAWDEKGKPLRLTGAHTDISEHKSRERRLHTLSVQFQAILDHTPAIIFLKDLDGRFLLVNKRFEELHGLKPGDIIGQIDAEALPRGALGGTSPLERAALTKSDSFSAEKTYSAAGQSRTFVLTQFPLRDADGEVWGRCGIAADITRDKLIQAEAMRAGQLAAIGELAAGVAHEINNPINGMINYAQILVDLFGENEEASSICKRIIKEGERIAHIVGNLLSFARHRTRENALFDVVETLQDALSLTRSQLVKDGIQLLLSVPAALPLVSGRKNEIQQVFLNILSNARYALNMRFPDAGAEKTLRIEASRMSRDNQEWISLAFEDHGVGIAEDRLERVYEPFYSTKPEGEGTGLGLSISREIVAAHGGELRVQSEAGSYTRVTVTLPGGGKTPF